MTDARSATYEDQIIGERLRALREKRGLSQQGLAAKMGITFQQIQKYEHGVNRIAASRLIAFTKALNKPITHFTKGL